MTSPRQLRLTNEAMRAIEDGREHLNAYLIIDHKLDENGLTVHILLKPHFVANFVGALEGCRCQPCTAILLALTNNEQIDRVSP